MILVFLLFLYIGPANLAPFVVSPVEQPQVEEDFTVAADGDSSSESITSFSESIADDTLFYPDVFHDTTIETADWGNNSANNPTGSVSDTTSKDGTVYGGSETVGEYIYVQLWFDVSVNIEGFTYSLFYNVSAGCNIWIWDHTAETWELLIGSPNGENTVLSWDNGTTYDNDHFNTTHVGFRFGKSGFAPLWVYIDYAELTLYEMTLADADHYAESFADVSDWTTSDVSITTDDDVATITENGASSSGRAYASFSSTDFFEYYYEFRIESMTATTANLEFWDGAAYNTLKTFSAAGIYSGIISDSDAATMQRIGFSVNSESGNIKPDYLRISPYNERGWQFDGSTTEGVTDGGGGSSSSDGDKLTLTADADGSTWEFVIDATATAAALSTNYYQFLHLSLSDHTGDYIRVRSYDGSAWATVITNITASTDMRCNIKAADSTITKFEVALNPSASVKLDYMGAFSISNYTVSGSGLTTTDYLYIDSGVLVSSKTTTSEIDLSYDPTISVNGLTYTVWNVSASNIGTNSFKFVTHLSGGGWVASSYDETRGPMQAGTMDVFYFAIFGDVSISSLKFIEDGTAPTVVRSFATPDPADDDETVTLSAVIEDTVEVYSVAFNGIVYPAGFSDVDYSATEQTDNLWTYSFNTLDAGYYCFKILGSDGANINALTEYGYISLTVRLGKIAISPITFFGVGNDFTQMQLSFDINRDCSYTIYESSDTYAEADTWTGSVIEGWNNIAWDKLTVTDEQADFGIEFVNGSLSTWVNGSYAVAQTTFYVERCSDNGPEFSETVTVTGRITKFATYTVYIDDVEATTGTITDLDFDIEFDKKATNAARKAWHDFAIRFVNGSQTCWYNSTFYLWKDIPDKPPGGGVVVFDENFWLKILIVMIGVTIGGVVLMRATGIGNLPDYKG